VCDVITVAHTVVLHVQYACVQSHCVTFIVISFVARLILSLSVLLQVIMHRLVIRVESTQCIL
jgi:hypothetical protein